MITRTRNVELEVLDDTRFAEGVMTLDGLGGVHQVATADLAGEHFIELAKLTPDKWVAHSDIICSFLFRFKLVFFFLVDPNETPIVENVRNFASLSFIQ